MRFMCKSKIHMATVTEANLNYMGSITIDSALMEAADLLAYEKVHVLNCSNGARLETYVIAGPRGDGDICLNGAAARLVDPGDKVIIIGYGVFSEKELEGFKPRVIFVNEKNRIQGVREERPFTETAF